MLKLKIILQSKLFLLVSLFFIILYILICTKWITYNSKLTDNITELSGQILSYRIDGNQLNLVVKSVEKVQVFYYIKSYEEKEYLKNNILIGAEIKLKGTLKTPYNNTIPNTFNYKQYLYNNKIYKIFTASQITLSNKTSFLNQIKTKFINKIEKVGRSSAYLYAFILGEIDYIENDVYQEYQKNGTTHLFAVSGMHISALVVFLTTLFKKIHLKEGISDLIIIAFLLFYMFLIGFTPSVLRGGLLYIFLLINRKSKLNLPTLYVLYILFLFLVLINPFYIYNLGFIYSFVTSFGLILFHRKIKGNYLKKLIQISIIAFLFSLPITLYNFYEINLLTIINNIIIVPLVTIFLFPLTLITFLIPIFDPILNIGIKILESISHLLNIFEVNLIVPKINLIFIIIYYFVLYLIYKYHLKYIFMIVILVIIFKILPYFDNNSYVYFLDVGQGDSTIIVGENRSFVVMIDTGGKIIYEEEEWEKRNKAYDNSNTIITCLKSLGISKIDLLIGTHGDTDHLGYADQIINDIKVENLWLNNNDKNEMEINLSHKIKKNTFNKLEIINLNNKMTEDENESSLVLYFKINEVSFLIMGDAPKSVEKKIASKYKLLVDIIKIGHHGSKTSSDETFLTKYHPQYAIISSGRNNRYNHPSLETLNTLSKLNIPYYNTQEKGTICYVIREKIKKIKFSPP